MRSLQRRKQDMWFVQRSLDTMSLGNTYTYTKPIHKRYSVSPTSGSVYEGYFGVLPTYDRYIICYEHDFIPEEGTMVYIDKKPEIGDDGYLVLGNDGEPTVKPDYTVSKIARTEKGVKTRIGISKVADKDSDSDSEDEDEDDTTTNTGTDDNSDDDGDLSLG